MSAQADMRAILSRLEDIRIELAKIRHEANKKTDALNAIYITHMGQLSMLLAIAAIGVPDAQQAP